MALLYLIETKMQRLLLCRVPDEFAALDTEWLMVSAWRNVEHYDELGALAANGPGGSKRDVLGEPVLQALRLKTDDVALFVELDQDTWNRFLRDPETIKSKDEY